jgi:hypothetical protein
MTKGDDWIVGGLALLLAKGPQDPRVVREGEGRGAAWNAADRPFQIPEPHDRGLKDSTRP